MGPKSLRLGGVWRRSVRPAVVALLVGVAVSLPPAPAAGAAEGTYIVVLKAREDPRAAADEHRRAHGAEIRHVYSAALRGYAARMSPEAARRVAADPRVALVEPDRTVHATAQTLPTGVKRIGGEQSAAASGNGGGSVDVDVAILDTGIDRDHPDLNVVGGKNCSTGTTYDDANGHGTHVAGIVGAKDDASGVVGVAPGARLHALAVLDSTGSGTWSSVICGIDWVTQNATTIEVANMSLAGTGSDGSCASTSLHQAICNSVNAGITYTAAAGNGGGDAGGSVPATYAEVITVSALADFDGLSGGLAPATCTADNDDTFFGSSAYGADIDLIAPGVCIRSTSKDGTYATMSGTSMAAPHVAGAAALYRAGTVASPGQVKTRLLETGSGNWINSDDGDAVKEPLVNVASPEGGQTPPPSNQSPVASFTSSCSGLSCSFTDTSTDAEGSISGWSWSFGDNVTSTQRSPSHTYGAAGTYTVSLTVTDSAGATNTATKSVTVSAPAQPPPAGAVVLSARGYLRGSYKLVDLTWSGATGSSVDVYKDGVKVTYTQNDGFHTTYAGPTGAARTYVFKVCERVANPRCSNEAKVTL